MTKITLDKALLEQAIEALEKERPYLGPVPNKVTAAITALRAALVKQAVEPCKECNGTGEVETGIGMMVCQECPGNGYTSPPPPAEPAAESQKPECYKWEEYRKWGKGWGWDTCEMEYDPRLPENAQYHKGTDFNDPEQVRNFRALYASPPPAKPRISTEHCSLAERQSHQASVNYPSDDLYCPRCQCSERFLQSRQCEPHIVYDAPPPAEVPLLTPGEVALMWVSESFDTMSYESCYTRGVKRGEQAVRRNAGLK
jgi:hypothetical protein